MALLAKFHTAIHTIETMPTFTTPISVGGTVDYQNLSAISNDGNLGTVLFVLDAIMLSDRVTQEPTAVLLRDIR